MALLPIDSRIALNLTVHPRGFTEDESIRKGAAGEGAAAALQGARALSGIEKSTGFPEFTHASHTVTFHRSSTWRRRQGKTTSSLFRWAMVGVRDSTFRALRARRGAPTPAHLLAKLALTCTLLDIP